LLDRRKVGCNCSDGIRLFSETRELRMVQISPCFSKQNGLRQQSFPPQSEQTLTIQVPRM